MIRVSQLGYVSLGVTDVAAWAAFAVDIVGLQLGETTSDGIYLRFDNAAYRLRVQEHDRNEVLALGLSVADEQSLKAFGDQLSEAGITSSRGSKEAAAARRVMEFVSFTDPNGVVLEVFQGLKVCPGEPIKTAFPHAGFVTGHEGLGHVGIWVDDLQASVRFYCEILGFRVTDWVDSQLFKGAFIRCNTRQHTLALFQSPPKRRPARLHHIQLEMVSLDDVGKAYDVAQKRKLVTGTLGKHPAEQAVTFYMKTPAGFGFELGWGGIRIDDATWQVGWHDERPVWGHEFIGLMD